MVNKINTFESVLYQTIKIHLSKTLINYTHPKQVHITGYTPHIPYVNWKARVSSRRNDKVFGDKVETSPTTNNDIYLFYAK